MARILTLDDVPAAVKAIQKILEKKGHKISGYTEVKSPLHWQNYLIKPVVQW